MKQRTVEVHKSNHGGSDSGKNTVVTNGKFGRERKNQTISHEQELQANDHRCDQLPFAQAGRFTTAASAAPQQTRPRQGSHGPVKSDIQNPTTLTAAGGQA